MVYIIGETKIFRFRDCNNHDFGSNPAIESKNKPDGTYESAFFVPDFENGLAITDGINPPFGLIKKPWGFQGFVDLNKIVDEKSLPYFPFPTKENPNQNIYPRLGFALIDNRKGNKEVSQNNHCHNFYSELVFVYAQGKAKITIEENITEIKDGWYAFFVPPGLYHDIIVGPNSLVVTCDIKNFNLKDRNSKHPSDKKESESEIGIKNNSNITNLQEEYVNYQDPIFGLTFLITTRKDSIDPKKYTLIEINPENFINGKIPNKMIDNVLESSSKVIEFIKALFKENEDTNYPVLYIGIPKPFDIFDLLK